MTPAPPPPPPPATTTGRKSSDVKRSGKTTRRRERRGEGGLLPPLRCFLAIVVVVATFWCRTKNSSPGNAFEDYGWMARKEEASSSSSFGRGGVFVSASEEDATAAATTKRLEVELAQAKRDVDAEREEKRLLEEKMSTDLNEMKRTKEEAELELRKSKSAIEEAKMKLEKTRKEKEKYEQSLNEEMQKGFQKSNDLKTEFVHFWEALKTFGEGATRKGKAKAKEGLDVLKVQTKVFGEHLKEKTSGVALIAKEKGLEYYAFAKVKSLEIGQFASKKAMEFDLPKKYETAKVKAKKVVMPKIKSSYEKVKKQVVSGVKKLQPQLKKAKKEMMPKIKSLYGKARKKVKSGVMKVQPQLKKAKKFVEEKTPKEAKKHAFRAYIFLRAAREDLVKILAARLLTMYENVEFFAPYATKSYAMFSAHVLVQTLTYYLAYRTLSRMLFGRRRAKANDNKRVSKSEKKAAKVVPKEVKGRSVEFSPPKTRATRIAAPFAAKRTTA